ncbi:MAG: hypothetical protein M1821_008308 [Bathelium mastoideum]|nr:MAG: hypothetical protein M1821_008308 [Bathelium mastoideum]KAI9693346.1 MAG: hypothetical protein M1822_005342 [Bathelium mastoideum]
MPRPVFLILLPNAPDADPAPRHWALFVPEPGRPNAGKYITLGRSSLLAPHHFVRIYKHGYDLDALVRAPSWEGEDSGEGGRGGEVQSQQADLQQQRRRVPGYERLSLGLVPDAWVVDLVRENRSTGVDEANDVFVVEAERVEVPATVSQGSSLVRQIPIWPLFENVGSVLGRISSINGDYLAMGKPKLDCGLCPSFDSDWRLEY